MSYQHLYARTFEDVCNLDIELPLNSNKLSNDFNVTHGSAVMSPRAVARLSESQRLQHRTATRWLIRDTQKPLRVMKFGGTSVEDASCIARTVNIIRTASRESKPLVVVSAMSGVTNKLIEAATESLCGHYEKAKTILQQLQTQHEAATRALFSCSVQRRLVEQKLWESFQEGQRLCEGIALLRELTGRARDAISSLGERLSCPILAAALDSQGVPSVPVDAAELIVTDSNFGAAKPHADLTRKRCEARLRPLLDEGMVPVVTGSIGANANGTITTLGRGGSDFSASILAASLRADEVTIWTDVDGVLTADPRLVPQARIIPEISYLEAADLSYFGAQVLHPKTLRPLIHSTIPVWIRNTFAPERGGTRIVPATCSGTGLVKAVTAMSDVALITVGGPDLSESPGLLARTFKATATAKAEVLLVSQSSSQNEIQFVICSDFVKDTIAALEREFAQELVNENIEHLTADSAVAIIAVVGHKLLGRSAIAARLLNSLSSGGIEIVAFAQGCAGCNISFLVLQKDMQSALNAVHREFELDRCKLQASA